MDETMDVGCDVGEPVSTDYRPNGNKFNGKVNWVQIDVDAAAKDWTIAWAPKNDLWSRWRAVSGVS